jgi:hypothetical protein
MVHHPLIIKVLCVAAVVAVVFPLGRMVFPHVAHMLDSFQFDAIEAVVSATLGFSIYTAIFG